MSQAQANDTDLSEGIKGFTCRKHNTTSSFYLRLGDGELLLRLSLEMLLPLGGLHKTTHFQQWNFLDICKTHKKNWNI
jgi:hypothetical protein